MFLLAIIESDVTVQPMIIESILAFSKINGITNHASENLSVYFK